MANVYRGETLDFDGEDTYIPVHADWDARFIQLVLIVVVTGLVMSFSASFPKAAKPDLDLIPGDAFIYFKWHIVFVILGLIGMWCAAYPNPRFLERISLPTFMMFLGMMAFVIIWGVSTRGSKLFLVLGPIKFQPSEFAKLFYVVYMASLLGQGPLEGHRSHSVRNRVLGATLVFCGLLFLQKDQGMMVLVFCIGLAMCFLSGLRWQHLSLILVGAASVVTLFALSSPERRERLLAWPDPLGHLDGAGMHISSMLVAIARGGIKGVGLGLSPEKWCMMPEPHTDSIFCVMAGELGLVVCALFLSVLGWMVWRCFEVARWSRDGFGYFLGCGIGIMYGVQALINMFVATNMMPVTGLTLPFISYGGSSLISCLLGAGMVLAIFRHNPTLRRE